MSISYTEIEDPVLEKRVALYGAKEFVNIKVDSTITEQLPFPTDHEFSSCFLPKKFRKLADRIQNQKIRPDDVWILSFPKSGTLWTYNIVRELKNNLSFSTEFLNKGTLFLEQSMFYEENQDNRHDNDFQKTLTFLDQRFEVLEYEESPRIIMSHLPAQFLPKDIWTVKPKLIYVYRNAKDVATSMYRMFKYQANLKYSGTMENFFDDFLNDCVVYSPFYAHVNGFRKLSQLDNVLFVNYKDLVAKPFDVTKRISEFLGFTYSDEQLKQLTEHVSFQNMQNNSEGAQDYHKNGFK